MNRENTPGTIFIVIYLKHARKKRHDFPFETVVTESTTARAREWNSEKKREKEREREKPKKKKKCWKKTGTIAASCWHRTHARCNVCVCVCVCVCVYRLSKWNVPMRRCASRRSQTPPSGSFSSLLLMTTLRVASALAGYSNNLRQMFI